MTPKTVVWAICLVSIPLGLILWNMGLIPRMLACFMFYGGIVGGLVGCLK